jgi:hypothetical protein
MNRYPFIAASLPDIQIGSRPEISFKEMEDLLALNLMNWDRKKVEELLELVDIDNIKALWLGLPLHSAGSMNAKELEEAILVKDFLPSFVIEFLERYETTEQRLDHFPALYTGLYQQMDLASDDFIRSYYAFEREVRLVLAALRAKQMKRDLVLELQFEDTHDPFVMQILVQKDAPDYFPPQEYEALKDLFMENHLDPMKLYRSLLQYRFDKILEIEGQYQSFTIDRILGFLARLMMVEMWNQLDEQKGLSLIDDLSKNG